MQSTKEQLEERRQSTRRMVDTLLTERQEVLVLYSRVAGLEPFAEQGPENQTLLEFVQVLVDYIATAHFGLYERILNGNERRKGVVKLAAKLYPQISESTDAAVDFNDNFDAAQGSMDFSQVSGDLSRLGEHLAIRIELEDQLINELLGKEGAAQAMANSLTH